MARRIEYIDALEHQLEWHKFTLSPLYIRLWAEITATEAIQSDEPFTYATPVRQGELFYVGREFCDLVERTALDLPDCYLQEEWLPVPIGLILFHHDLPLPRLERRGRMVCDFCRGSEPQYEYPTKDFTYNTKVAGLPRVGMPSLGSWAACSVCATFIENGDLAEVGKRAVESFVRLNPDKVAFIESNREAQIRDSVDLVIEFMKHRSGPRRPIHEEGLNLRALGFIRQAGNVIMTTYLEQPWTRIQSTRAFYPLSIANWPYDTSMVKKIVTFESKAGTGGLTGANAPYVDGSNQHELKYFAALLLLMNQRLLTTERVQVERQQQKRFKRDVYREVKDMKVVVLRRTMSTTQNDEQHRVDWTCRWIVRGHWRQQWYPSRSVHNPVWISPFVKGPADLPVKEPSKSLFAVVR